MRTYRGFGLYDICIDVTTGEVSFIFDAITRGNANDNDDRTRYTKSLNITSIKDIKYIQIGTTNEYNGSYTFHIDNIALYTVGAAASSKAYTINAAAGGSIIKEFASGYCPEGGNYNCYVPKVVEDNNHHFYVLDDNENANLDGYYASYTMGSSDEDKKINYTLNEGIVGFSDVGTGSDKNYSSGGYTNVNSYLASCTLDAGLYRAEIYVVSKAGNGSHTRNESIMVGGESKSTTTVDATGLQQLYFTVEADDTEVYVKGNGASNYTDNLDYVLIRKMPIVEGEYYLKNKATGAYFAAGQNWGTQAITNSIGHIVSMEYNLDGTWKVNANINNKYLTSGLFCDGTAQNWILSSDGAGYFTISDGSNFITAGASGAALSLTTGTGDNTKWQFLTAAEWKAENVARLTAATADNGVDATFYIPAANFNRYDGENSKWQGSPGINGNNVSEGNNFNGEKFTNPYATFDVYQALTGLKAGAYKLTAQGYYRNGLNNDDATIRRALLYANDVTVPLLNIAAEGKDAADETNGFSTNKSGKYVPDSQSDASKAFNAGCYNNELYVVVGDDGNLRLGVKKTDATGADKDWACFDNFQLTYYGETVPMTITNAEWASFSNANEVAIPAGVTAYYASAGNSTSVTLKEITSGYIPANTGVVLNATAGTYLATKTSTSATLGGDNLLHPWLTAGTPSEGTYYTLAAGPTFKRSTGGTLAAGKAYLVLPTSARELSVVFDNETNGIQQVESAAQSKGAYYNLAGQRVAQPTKGLYIVNGKKVVIK